MASKKNTWIVTALKQNAIVNDERSMIEVTDKENAQKVASLMKYLGCAAHYYPKGYYPEFDKDGNLV